MDTKNISQMISVVRKRAGLTQEELAEKLCVTVQAVSKWENGHNLPDIENIFKIAEVTNVPYTVLFDGQTDAPNGHFKYKDRLFHEDNMYTRMRTFALDNNLDETFRALQYMREQHFGQFRKGNKYSTEKILYINHPLLMACQANAFGIKDDALFSAILLHDVVEDTGVTLDELPFSDEVKEIVGLVTFKVLPRLTKEESKKIYYDKIKQNGKACMVKAIDRCNNISTMAGSFAREKIIEYIAETEEYVFPVLEMLKNNYPEYHSIAFLLKYHMLSVLESIKYLV